MSIVSWWSGGVTSAVACKIALESLQDVKVVMLDTMNEDEDTYRFLEDCEKWYGVEIEKFKHPGYESIEEVWQKYKSLSSATGAVCSDILKNHAREVYCKSNEVSGHVFGFEFHKKEINRAKNWERNKGLKAYFPLIDAKITKKQAISAIESVGIKIPRVYKYGFNNNNCFKTGCVQGGIGYWQKIQKEFPEKFESMAKMEHELSTLKGEPVVICHDQRKTRKITEWDYSKRTGEPTKKSKLFLKHNKCFPEVPTIDVIKGKHVPMVERFDCNGFCSLEENGNKLDFMELFNDQ